jgi:RNA polymerase sigma factor for flagellar operon FliA
MNARSEYLRVQRAASDDLVREHTGMVRRVAYHLMARLPANVDVDDLIQSGMVGLLEAAMNYTGGGTASFETFATPRIRGAMLDELRRGDWAPRSVRRKVRQMTEVTCQVERDTGGTASKAEVMRRMGIDTHEYERILSDAAQARILSLPLDADEGGAKISATAADSPESGFEGAGLRQALADAIAGLPEREQQVIALYYDQEFNLREIGAVLGVSESRVCQIHGQAIIRLRARMSDWREQA